MSSGGKSSQTRAPIKPFDFIANEWATQLQEQPT